MRQVNWHRSCPSRRLRRPTCGNLFVHACLRRSSRTPESHTGRLWRPHCAMTGRKIDHSFWGEEATRTLHLFEVQHHTWVQLQPPLPSFFLASLGVDGAARPLSSERSIGRNFSKKGVLSPAAGETIVAAIVHIPPPPTPPGAKKSGESPSPSVFRGSCRCHRMACDRRAVSW
jgi:hypothetical protein